MALTGRFWFRRTWTGKLVLLVEEETPCWFSRGKATKLRWRDAKLLDMADPSMRPLMNLEQSTRADPKAPRRDIYAGTPVGK